jgi:RNA polymerase sigma-70 factor (ECF subfamily)
MARDERDLVERCLAGSQSACTALVEAYARMVGTVIWRATGQRDAIEDLTQETFLRVFKALPYFDAHARLSTWIYTIAHNIAIDHLRRTGAWREESLTPDDVPDEGPSGRSLTFQGLDPEALLSRTEVETVVHECLAQLPQKYRLPIVYAAIEGLDYPTIARMLGIPVGTVKTLIFRGKRMLKMEISRKWGRPNGI